MAKPKKNKTSRPKVQAYCTAQDVERFQEAADADYSTLSGWMLRCLRNEADVNGIRIICPDKDLEQWKEAAAERRLDLENWCRSTLHEEAKAALEEKEAETDNLIFALLRLLGPDNIDLKAAAEDPRKFADKYVQENDPNNE